jgi:hypothetical protein
MRVLNGGGGHEPPSMPGYVFIVSLVWGITFYVCGIVTTICENRQTQAEISLQSAP